MTAAAYQPKFAICNEIYGDVAIAAQSFADMATAGYTGVEIAPFTLGALIHDLPQAKTIGDLARAHGLEVVGLHWLLAKTEGYHLTTPDPSVQRATIDYAKHLCDLCQALRGGTPGGIMVWGSPQQRSFPEHQSREDAYRRAVDAMQPIGEYAIAAGVTIAFEPLGPNETNFITSAAEGTTFCDDVNQPSIKLHLDVKAMANEIRQGSSSDGGGQRVGDDGETIAQTIKANTKHLAHFHANDPNLRGPGQGGVDYAPIGTALSEIDYRGWISVEVFDFTPDAPTIARESMGAMRSSISG